MSDTERIKKLEKALREITELTECECGQLAFRSDCTYCVASDALRQESSGPALPDEPRGEAVIEFTDDVKWILSKPNFWCGPIAHRLVKLGLAKIDGRSEDEQAYVLHWLLCLHEKHGANFREEADKILRGPQSAAPAQPLALPGKGET